MTAELRLFDLPAPPEDDVDVDPPEGLSAGRKRTLRNRALIDAGVHPATRRPLRDGATCGSCDHLVTTCTGPGRIFYKCGLVPLTAGAGTDVRLSWPACELWKPVHRLAGVVDVDVKGDVL